MSATPLTRVIVTEIDSNGDPLSSGKVYAFETGTATPKTTWTDSSKGTPNAHPVVLNSNGQADIWIDSTDGQYRIRVDDANDVTVWGPVDNVDNYVQANVGGDTIFLLEHTAAGRHLDPDSSSYTDFATAVSTIGATETTLVVSTVEAVTGNVTVPKTLSLRFIGAGELNISTGITVTINGALEAPLSKIFDNALASQGTVEFGAESVEALKPEWWGIDRTGVADASAEMQATVVASLDSTIPISVSAGKYSLGTAVTITGGNFHMYGTGMNTVFHGTSTNNLFELTGSDGAYRDLNVQGVASGGDAFEMTESHRNSFTNIYCNGLAAKVFHLRGCLENVWYTPYLSVNFTSPYPSGMASGIDTCIHMETFNAITCNANSIFHPIIENGITYGIYIEGGDNNTIIGGVIQDNTGGDGLYLTGTAFTHVSGTWFEGWDTSGITLDGADRTILHSIQGGGAKIFLKASSHRNSIIGGRIVVLNIDQTCSLNSYQDALIATLEDFGASRYVKQVQVGGSISTYAPDVAYLPRTAAATTGTWREGDITPRLDPAAGEYAGWVATTNGTFSTATDSTGDTDGSTAVITGMTDTSDFVISDYVTVSAGFPSASTPYQIRAITSTTITLDTNSDSSQSDVTVATVDPVFTKMPNLDLQGSAAWDPGNIADGDEEAKEVTVTGSVLGDFAVASFSLDVTDITLDAQVTVANTVTCILANNTGGAIDLGSGTVYVKVFKK